MLRIFKISFIVAILWLPLFAGAQTGEERVLSYNSDIQVLADSSMVVKETIKVLSSGDQIRHGIYRDFPIAYKDNLGRRYFVGFTLLGVTRDGAADGYHTQRGGNGIRIYIGNEEVIIPPGEHTYTIEYKTDRQLGFFEDHDELYWNVTGNGWVFPMDFVTASVSLPGGIPKDKITTTLYTGPQGSSEQEGSAMISPSGAVEFIAGRTLGAYEGLTIVVGWPKGFVTPPTNAQNFLAILHANLDFIVGLIGFIVVFIFYFYFWYKRGRDPKKGTIIAQYEAPRGYSPAFLRFVRRMGNDNRAFAASIINLAVKGKLAITEKKGMFGKVAYTLTKKDASNNSVLPEEEKLLADKLFEKGDSLELEKSNALEISAIQKDFADLLKGQAGKKYFTKNTLILILGFALSIAAFVGTVVAAISVRFSVDSLLVILFWPALFLGFLVVNIVFARLIRAYAPEGRKLVDDIEGFKLFLSVTEKDRLAFHNPPQQTPELFEKMLPYALALGVEHQWAKQFASVFAQLESRGTAYAPLWYYGALGHFNADNFASSVGSSFTGVVSSASTPPGSSSGFSGGSSGGGGGGGGGGGW